MKRFYFLMGTIVASFPLAMAAQKGSIEKGLELMFDAAGSDIFVKLALWMVLFSGLYFGAQKAFPEEKRIAAVISIIISFIAVRFMPIEMLGAFKIYLPIVALLLIPYFLVSMVFEPGWTRRIAYIASVLLLWFLFSPFGPIYGRVKGTELFEYMFFWVSSEWIFGIPFHWLILAVVALVGLIWGLAKWAGGREWGSGDGGGGGAGFLSKMLGNWGEHRRQKNLMKLEDKLARKQQKAADKAALKDWKRQEKAQRKAEKSRLKELKRQERMADKARRDEERRNRKMPGRDQRTLISQQPHPEPRPQGPLPGINAPLPGATRGPEARPQPQGPLPGINAPPPKKPGILRRIFTPPKGYKPPMAGPPKGYKPYVQPGTGQQLPKPSSVWGRKTPPPGKTSAERPPMPTKPMRGKTPPPPPRVGPGSRVAPRGGESPQERPGLIKRMFGKKPPRPIPGPVSAPPPKGIFSTLGRRDKMVKVREEKNVKPWVRTGPASAPKPRGFWSSLGRRDKMANAREVRKPGVRTPGPASAPKPRGFWSSLGRRDKMERAFKAKMEKGTRPRPVPPPPKGYKAPVAGAPAGYREDNKMRRAGIKKRRLV